MANPQYINWDVPRAVALTKEEADALERVPKEQRHPELRKIRHSRKAQRNVAKKIRHRRFAEQKKRQRQARKNNREWGAR